MMADGAENKSNSVSNLKCIEFCRDKITWRNIYHCCCRSRRDARLFWYIYSFMLIVLFILFMVAFLLKPSINITYVRWYDDVCTIDVTTKYPIIECDRSLRLYCSTASERCACLHNMYWNGSFCDCSTGMYYNGVGCQARLRFGQPCNPNSDLCTNYLECSTTTNTCDCPSTSYYNQTTCNPRLAYNATQPCTLSSQCVSGLDCK